ncbi:glycosyltransferase family 2 protein [Deinococcus radiotolerans]|uniref:Beta 1,4 glucosyltransferase n=1 Tax=Deinococcus radiotolerans TaxID=1309407 RepID=A0ABQ2FJL4_9DEIO|nr:glycosyltransferase family 2 protein [Deinococcus radiotolerans]GGK95156.1 beta 1,4 glucosyltransferase [Deinococcus radiotolerans]
MISVVIIAKNEAERIESCLKSALAISSDVIVVDMQSVDGTIEVCAKMGARVYSVKDYGYADPAREYAISKSYSEWVLILDADEVVSPLLGIEILHTISSYRYDVIELPYQNYMMGRKITASGWGPEQDYHIRLFKKDAMHVSGEVHKFFQPKANAIVGRIKSSDGVCIMHFSYDDLSHFISKIDRYTNLESLKENRENSIKEFISIILEFPNRFLRKSGWRDGKVGFDIALLMTVYKYLVFSKKYDRKHGKTLAENRNWYQSIKEKALF